MVLHRRYTDKLIKMFIRWEKKKLLNIQWGKECANITRVLVLKNVLAKRRKKIFHFKILHKIVNWKIYVHTLYIFLTKLHSTAFVHSNKNVYIADKTLNTKHTFHSIRKLLLNSTVSLFNHSVLMCDMSVYKISTKIRYTIMGHWALHSHTLVWSPWFTSY